mmetsp:Transcript_11681/g.38797  ORF Transcript_11681/g.38797 Transcript_11681/m.38797 type:complete len:207 (-) Transcript_11681:157-777(-)
MNRVMYCVNSSQICSLAVVSRNRNPGSVTPSSSPTLLSPISFAARNSAATSRPAATFFFFFPGSYSASRELKSNASLAPVSVRTSASHRPLAKLSSVSLVGTFRACTSSVEASSVQSPALSSTLKLRSNICRNPDRNVEFSRTCSSCVCELPCEVSSFEAGSTDTNTRKRRMCARHARCTASPSGLIHASTSATGTPDSMYNNRMA